MWYNRAPVHQSHKLNLVPAPLHGIHRKLSGQIFHAKSEYTFEIPQSLAQMPNNLDQLPKQIIALHLKELSMK